MLKKCLSKKASVLVFDDFSEIDIFVRIKMGELNKLLNDYIASVPGILGIILSDKEGIPIIR